MTLRSSKVNMLIHGMYRSVFVSLVAILFGVVQILCACLPANASTPMQSAEPAAYEVVSIGLAHSILGDSDERSAPTHPDDHAPEGEHEHANDCTHCDTSDSYLMNAEQNIAPSIHSADTQKIVWSVGDLNTQARANFAPSALAGLRWLHPPAPTLVQLKIKLLN